jgi:HlyD family secretion protein
VIRQIVDIPEGDFMTSTQTNSNNGFQEDITTPAGQQPQKDVITSTGTDSNNSLKKDITTPVKEQSEVSQTQQTQLAKPEIPPKKPKVSKPVLIVGAIALIAGVGFAIYRVFFYNPEPDGIFLSGRIEGYETDVSAKIGGKVASVSVREGDNVKPGQLLVRLDDSDLQAQLQGNIAAMRQAKEVVMRYRQQLPILQAQLQQANLTINQAQQDSQGRVRQSKNALASSRADLEEALANLKLAQSQQKRYRALYGQGVVSADSADQYDTSAAADKAKVEAARQTMRAAKGTLEQARATLTNLPIKAAAALEVEKQIAQGKTDISVYQQALRSAEATQAQTQANLNYLVIKSPMTGNVITRNAEPGEVIAAGAPLLTLVNQQHLYMRGFVPEGQIGNVKLGQRSLIYLDSDPKHPLEARVSRIDPKASFTPENIYFKKDRVTQVFGVELTLKDPQGLAKQGMPADGNILFPIKSK